MAIAVFRKKEPVKKAELPRAKKIELSIRNNVIAMILSGPRLPIDNNDTYVETYTEPQRRDFWYQRQHNQEYYAIYYQHNVVAHYHKKNNTLEIFDHDDSPMVQYFKKILDNVFCNYVNNVKITHIRECMNDVQQTPEQQEPDREDFYTSLRRIIGDL